MMDWIESLADRGFGCFIVVYGGIFLGAVVILFGCIAIVFVGLEKANWAAREAEIAQLRRDVAEADPGIGADVVGQAVTFNRNLAARKASNSRWWIDPFIADEWMEVEPISLTRSR